MFQFKRRLLRLLILMPIAACGAVQSVCLAEDLPPILESQPLSQSPPVVSHDLPLEARVSRLESLLDDQTLLDMLVRLEELQKDVQELRGSVEVQAHDIEGIKQRQRDLYLDIDRRLRQFETAGVNAPSAAAPASSPAQPGMNMTPSVATPRVTEPVSPPSGQPTESPAANTDMQQNVDALAEQSAYQNAFNVLKEGRYDEAINEFSAFLTRYPNGQFSGNAQYWLGEANYVTRHFPTAVEEFNKVLVSYPDSNKVPDAMLKLGFSYYELSDWDQTNTILKQLIERFPKSTAAQLAQNRLHRMKLEGR